MPTEQKQIVYILIDLKKEVPPQNGFYTCYCGDEFMGQKWYNHQDDGFNFPSITHWLKPVELSTLVEERVKELKVNMSRLYEENKQLQQSSYDQYNSLNEINTVMCESWMIKGYPFGRKDGEKVMSILNKWATKY